MRIYAIWNTNSMEFLKWGVNGGGKEGYCLLRGMPMFFTRREQAESVIESFGSVSRYYEVREFEEVQS